MLAVKIHFCEKVPKWRKRPPVRSEWAILKCGIREKTRTPRHVAQITISKGV
nr:MAG TPA: hypothetical protein [Caudoviricetes sp.]